MLEVSSLVGFPSVDFPGLRRFLCPLHLPGTDAFFGQIVVEDQVVAKGDAHDERVVRDLFDSVDLEFGGGNAIHRSQPCAHVVNECVSTE